MITLMVRGLRRVRRRLQTRRMGTPTETVGKPSSTNR